MKILDHSIEPCEPLEVISVLLEAADLLNLIVPLDILPALPAHQFYFIDSVLGKFKAGSVSYADNGGDISVYYKNTAPAAGGLIAAEPDAAFIALVNVDGLFSNSLPTFSQPASTPKGSAISVINSAGAGTDLTLGNGTLELRITFRKLEF